MPAIGNIAIADGKGAPVTHTFTPINTSGGKASLENRNTTFAAGSEQLSVAVTRVPGKETSDQIQLELILPVVAAVNGVDTVVRTSKAKVVLYVSKSGSSAERKDLRVLLKNALDNALVATAVENVEWLY